MAQSFQYVEGYLESKGYKLVLAVKHRRTGLLSENYLPIKYYVSEAYNDIYNRDLGVKPKAPIRDHRTSRNVDNYYSDSEGESVEDLEFY